MVEQVWTIREIAKRLFASELSSRIELVRDACGSCFQRCDVASDVFNASEIEQVRQTLEEWDYLTLQPN